MVGQPGNDASLATSAREVVAGVERLRDRYRTRARQHRIWFRSSGVLVIVLSATLPLLAGLEFERKDLALGTVGVLIALATALRNFYQWDQLWSLLRQSDFELSYLLDRWHLDVAALENEPPEKRPAQLHALTTALRDAAEDVRRSESTGYFGSLRFPNGQQ